MSLCPDPPPAPTQQPPTSFHMATELKPRPTLPTWKVVQRQHKEEKKSEGAFLALHLSSSDHRKKGFLSHLHNSWGTQEKTVFWVCKKVWMEWSWGVEWYVCQSLCPWTHLPYFFPFITTTHTHSHCPLFVINLWYKSIASPPINTSPWQVNNFNMRWQTRKLVMAQAIYCRLEHLGHDRGKSWSPTSTR